MYGTIMVGVDGSKYAEKALDAGIELAKMYGSKLIIATVYADDRFETFGFETPLAPPPEAQKRIDEMLKGYEILARGRGVTAVEAKTIASFWKVGAGLVLEAENRGCPLIVLGSRGTTGIGRVLLGSVAEFVANNAHCDVQVVR